MLELPKDSEVDNEVRLLLEDITQHLSPRYGGLFEQREISYLDDVGRSLVEVEEGTKKFLLGLIKIPYKVEHPVVTLMVPGKSSARNREKGFCQVQEEMHYDSIVERIKAYESGNPDPIKFGVVKGKQHPKFYTR